MMSTSVIKDLNYYNDLASEDYYLGGGEPPGEWGGLASKYLKLDKVVTSDDYFNIFQGRSPDGSPLCESAGKNHRAGWDLTFSAPKSVSVLWARADDDLRQKIQQAQKDAVKTAVRFIEDHAAITRRGHAGLIQEPVAGVIAAMFEHSTSRALDPQLHTHCLIANIAPRNDGTWGTLESIKIMRWQKAISAVYRSSLANSIREVGFSIEQRQSQTHFEIEGIPDSLCNHFSKRTKEIRELLDSLGIENSSSKVGDIAALSTRTQKDDVDRAKLISEWQRKMDEKGFTQSTCESLTHQDEAFIASLTHTTAIADSLIDKYATFKLQDIYTEVAILGQWTKASVTQIEHTVEQVIESEEIVDLGRDDNNNEIFTTKTMLAAERKLIELTDQLQQTNLFKIPEDIIQSSVDQQEKTCGHALSDEQTEGVFGVCQSGMDILQGAAGAGKSTSMRATRIAHEQMGFNVIGAAVSRQAALQLEQETGIRSSTVAKLLIDIKARKLDIKNSVILVDEASQISTLDLLELTKCVYAEKAKVVLVGEQQQLDAITHGGALRYLSERHGCHRLETIRRQREEWAREAVHNLRIGNASKALKAFDEHGLLSFSGDRENTHNTLIKKWQCYITENPTKQSLILAQRWADVKPLCDLARTVYQKQGKLGNEDIEITCVTGKHRFDFCFSSGEKIRFTKNDYKLGLTNGEQGTVTKVERVENDVFMEIKTDSGRKIKLHQSEYCNEDGRLQIVHAYAMTVYASQGKTIDGDVFVYYSSGMDRANSYVAGSRHKNNCHWFANSGELNLNTSSQQEKMASLANQMSSLKNQTLAIENEKESFKVSEL